MPICELLAKRVAVQQLLAVSCFTCASCLATFLTSDYHAGTNEKACRHCARLIEIWNCWRRLVNVVPYKVHLCITLALRARRLAESASAGATPSSPGANRAASSKLCTAGSSSEASSTSPSAYISQLHAYFMTDAFAESVNKVVCVHTCHHSL